jgi:Ca2+-binding RTX toxin-like protein
MSDSTSRLFGQGGNDHLDGASGPDRFVFVGIVGHDGAVISLDTNDSITLYT